MTKFDKNLKSVSEIISAGIAAIDDNIKSELSEQINYLFQNFEKNVTENNVNGLIELIDNSFTSNVHSILAEIIDKETYFRFGAELLKLDEKELNGLIHCYLDLFRLSEFLQKIYNETKWEYLIYELILKSNFSFADIVYRRYLFSPNKTVFNIIHGNSLRTYTWNYIYSNIKEYSRSFYYYRAENKSSQFKIAFLMENSLKMAMLDITCLTSGFVNVMIPANSVPQHISFILNQTRAELILVSSEKQLSKLKSVKSELKYLKKAILVEGKSAENWVINFDEFLSETPDNYEFSDGRIDNQSTATIMYTSGTTGEPKGIVFSHVNLIYKRFCRAMALPEIGEKDKFISYLPLYHTFGRFLEMTGSLFWNAEYTFMENPSLSTMISNMKFSSPSILISIPKKWMQLYDHISSLIDIEFESDEKIKEVISSTTGGNLKWGLSAAGYLPPEVFQFFQKYGIELMSGFGMTEATGGITMTPIGNYVPNSLGGRLPGIDIKLADDGELLIKGNYVMTGYYGFNYRETFDADGWVATGDIMKMDQNGFIEIIDRKKEIYKNIKGETVAPQKIENLFKDFDTVKQVFLVGDHRQYNTVLVYPDVQNELIIGLSREEMKTYFSSIIVTVNKFLAPFERILNFKIIDRSFSEEKGELTPKGTYKRRVIEQNFNPIIETMYEKDYIIISDDDIRLKIPNWFLREKGCLSSNIIFENNYIHLSKIKKKLEVRRVSKNTYQIGSYEYHISENFIDLSLFLTNPIYWLGNEKFLDFSGLSIYQWYRKSRFQKEIKFLKRVSEVNYGNEERHRMKLIMEAGECSFQGLHLASMHLQNNEEKDNEIGVEYFEMLLKDDSIFVYSVAKQLLKRPRLTINKQYRRKIFALAIDVYSGEELKAILRTYLNFNYDILNDILIKKLTEHKEGKANLEKFVSLIDEYLYQYESGYNIDTSPIPSLLKLLVNFGILHPTLFKTLRHILMGYYIYSVNSQLSVLIRASLRFLLNGFRDWIGPNQLVTVDPETGNEYKWKDVVIFEEGIESEDIEIIKKTIENTSLIREAIFLFSKGALVRLDDILPAGLWVSLINSEYKRSIYRISVQTRHQGSFDVIFNLVKNASDVEIESEINWLIAASAADEGTKLIDDFGTYDDSYKVWTEEFKGGESLQKYFIRSKRKKDKNFTVKLKNQWPFFVWNAAAAFYSFLKLTNYKYEVFDQSSNNIVIPLHDYQSGTRIVDISSKHGSNSIDSFFLRFVKNFISPTLEEFPFLEKKSIWNYIFSGIYEAEGEENGVDILRALLIQLKNNSEEDKQLNTIIARLELFIKSIIEKEFIPRTLFFAIKRYHRWYKLNLDASKIARSQMVKELFDTYNLENLLSFYPETRVRFFLETVFKSSNKQLIEKLDDIVHKLHKEELSGDELLNEYAIINDSLELSEDEKYFIARLCYPHLRPSDEAGFIVSKLNESESANLVVQMDDYDGIQFFIRQPISPREIAKLHKLFIDANLQVNFKPDNHFLVAVSERGFIIGGLYYFLLDQDTVHMEKIVVSNNYRRKGISEGLMTEFFNRMRDENHIAVTTGFFRPEYFYKFGFKIGAKYSGLVKLLDKDVLPELEEDDEI